MFSRAFGAIIVREVTICTILGHGEGLFVEFSNMGVSGRRGLALEMGLGLGSQFWDLGRRLWAVGAWDCDGRRGDVFNIDVLGNGIRCV